MVDTSAAVAILTQEPGSDLLVRVLAEADERVMSTGTAIELGIVLEARIGPAAPAIIERFMRVGGIELVAVDQQHVDRAMEGWRRFGRRRHRAGLNMGDLYAYALSVARALPVLSVGADFPATDVEIAGE